MKKATVGSSSPLLAWRGERREALADALRGEDEDSENKQRALERSCASYTSLGRVWGLREASVAWYWDCLAPQGEARLGPSRPVRSSRGTEESRFAEASLLAKTQAGEGNLIQTGIETDYRHWRSSRGTGQRGHWRSKENWSRNNKTKAVIKLGWVPL